MDEEYKQSDISKVVEQLMDEEGYEFGEAVKKAMEMGYKDGGLMVAIQKFNQGGRAYDSRASLEDMAKAIQTSSAGNDDQKLRLLMDYSMSMNPNVTPQNVSSSQGKMEKLLGLQNNPNFNYMKPSGPALLMPPMVSTGFRQDPGYFGNQGIMINGKRYMSEDEAIDDMGVETYNRFMADGGMAGDKTYHQFHDQYVPMDEESMGYAYGGGVGSMMQPRMNFAGGGMDYEPLGYNEDESITVEDLTVPSRVGDFRVSASKPLNDQSGIISAATNIMSPGVNTIEGSLIDGDDPSSRYAVQQDFKSDRPFDRDFSEFDKARMGQQDLEITDRNRGQIIERTPSTPFDRGITMADIAGPSTIDRFSNTVGPVPNVEATYQDKIMGGLDGNPDPYNFSQNFDQSYDASSDALVPGMGKKAIDFKDDRVDFMLRENNPNVFDPVVNTKNFVQDGITNITDYAKKNLTPSNIAKSTIGSKIGSVFGLPAIIGGLLGRTLFGNKNEFEGPYDDINNDGVIDRFDKARTTFGQSKTLKEYFEKVRAIKENREKEKAAAAAAAAAAASRAESARQYNPAVHGPNNYGLGSDGNQSFDSGQGFGTNATTGGPVSNRSGRGRTDYKDGGIVNLRR